MPDSATVRGTKNIATGNSRTNAISALVDTKIRDTVNTAEIVIIASADPQTPDHESGTARATPAVTQTDGYGNALPSTSLPPLPVWRPQAGKAAILMTPQEGDKAVAVFMKRDSSGVNHLSGSPERPATFRAFDQADGVIFNGAHGAKPEIWLSLDPESGDISLSTKSADMDISCRESGDIHIKTGSGNITIQAGNGGEGTITLDGAVEITRTLRVRNRDNEAPSSFRGGFDNTEGVVRSNGITLETHTHGGVDRGNSNTDGPNRG